MLQQAWTVSRTQNFWQKAAVLGHLERGSEAKAALDRYLTLRPNLKVRDDYRRIFVPNSALADPIIEGLARRAGSRRGENRYWRFRYACSLHPSLSL